MVQRRVTRVRIRTGREATTALFGTTLLTGVETDSGNESTPDRKPLLDEVRRHQRALLRANSQIPSPVRLDDRMAERYRERLVAGMEDV